MEKWRQAKRWPVIGSRGKLGEKKEERPKDLSEVSAALDLTHPGSLYNPDAQFPPEGNWLSSPRWHLLTHFLPSRNFTCDFKTAMKDKFFVCWFGLFAFNCAGSAFLCADSLVAAHRLLSWQHKNFSFRCTSFFICGALPLRHVGSGDERLTFSD